MAFPRRRRRQIEFTLLKDGENPTTLDARDETGEPIEPEVLGELFGVAGVGEVSSVAGRAGVVTLAKADVGLGNVDNTTDINKPVSTAQQTALNLKAPLASPAFTGNVSGITKSMVGLGSVDNVSAADLRDRSTHTGTQSADTLIDGTTTKAFLATERTRLAGIVYPNTSQATVVGRTPWLDARDYGVIGDGTTDDTSALQAAVNAAGTSGRRLYIPKPASFYKLTDKITIGAYYGLCISGDSWQTTTIKQTADNTPIFAFTVDNTHSVTIENLFLTYANYQNFASHPESAAICRYNSNGQNSLSGIYTLRFSNLNISKATYGFAVIRAFSGDTTSTNPWWGSLWENVQFSGIARTAININLGSVGAPCNTFRRIAVLMNHATAPNDGTAAALVLRGEAIMESIDIEQWTNTAINITSGNHFLIRGLHIEHHYTTDGPRTVYAASCTLEIQGYLFAPASADTYGSTRNMVYLGGGCALKLSSVTKVSGQTGNINVVEVGVSTGNVVQVDGLNPTLTGPIWGGTNTINQVRSVDGLAPTRLSTDPALPTASAAYAGRSFHVSGGSGVADSLVTCLKAADGSYSWTAVSTG